MQRDALSRGLDFLIEEGAAATRPRPARDHVGEQLFKASLDVSDPHAQTLKLIRGITEAQHAAPYSDERSRLIETAQRDIAEITATYSAIFDRLEAARLGQAEPVVVRAEVVGS